METVVHLSLESLQQGLDEIRRSPTDHGVLRSIVRRPKSTFREVLEIGDLIVDRGLDGDAWGKRDGQSLDTQLTLMNVRAADLVAGGPDRRALAGDQLFVDLDLSTENLPPGTRLRIGSAEIEITAEPHTGCGKFKARFGGDALKFVNSPEGRALNLRGIYARVVSSGAIRPGDAIDKV